MTCVLVVRDVPEEEVIYSSSGLGSHVIGSGNGLENIDVWETVGNRAIWS